jgi:hypothetical protein
MASESITCRNCGHTAGPGPECATCRFNPVGVKVRPARAGHKRDGDCGDVSAIYSIGDGSVDDLKLLVRWGSDGKLTIEPRADLTALSAGELEPPPPDLRSTPIDAARVRRRAVRRHLAGREAAGGGHA